MRKHLLSFILGVITFAIGVVAVPSGVVQIRRDAAIDEGQACSVRTFTSDSGEKVVIWSCRATTSQQSPKEHFENQVGHYSVISRSDNRAVVSYFTGEQLAYCVLRLDAGRQNDICSQELESILELERDYFRD